MINPPVLALKRRANELKCSAQREMLHDQDSAGLLWFYASECALKAVYMLRNNLKHTEDVRSNLQSARSYGHNLVSIINVLNVPAVSVGRPPSIVLQRTRDTISLVYLHEAWRYGEKVVPAADVCSWLERVCEWARQNT